MNRIDRAGEYNERDENEGVRPVGNVDNERIPKRLRLLSGADAEFQLFYLLIVPNAEPEAIKEALNMNLLTILPC